MTNKREVEKAIKKYMNINTIYYDINTTNKNVYINFKSINPYKTIFNLDIDYNTLKQKREILKNFIHLLKNFNFNYTLEFYKLNEIEEFLK